MSRPRTATLRSGGKSPLWTRSQATKSRISTFAPHPGREAGEGGAVPRRGRAVAHPAVELRRVRPVRLQGHDVEAVPLDQPAGDGSAGAVELARAVRRLAEQHHARSPEAVERGAERLDVVQRRQRLGRGGDQPRQVRVSVLPSALIVAQIPRASSHRLVPDSRVAPKRHVVRGARAERVASAADALWRRNVAAFHARSRCDPDPPLPLRSARARRWEAGARATPASATVQTRAAAERPQPTRWLGGPPDQGRRAAGAAAFQGQLRAARTRCCPDRAERTAG